MLDLLFTNANIINGNSDPIFFGNLGIENGKILYIGNDIPPYRRTINLNGDYLTPGFIDIHTHTDLEIIRSPELYKRLQQGITTDVNGNCGMGCFPYKDGSLLPLYTEDILGRIDYPWSWSDYSSFKDVINAVHPGVNEAFLTPHAALRVSVMGRDVMRRATKEEIEEMKILLKKQLDEGSIGFSTGLGYVPCSFSDDKELEELCKTTKECGKIFTIHHRREGDGCFLSLKNALDIALKTGVKTEISHLKAIGKRNGSEVVKMLKAIEEYRKMGSDVYFDQYPYSFGSTSLFSLLPPRVLSLKREDILSLLKKKEERERIKYEIEHPDTWDSIYSLCGCENIKVILLEHSSFENGKTLFEIGKEMSEDPLDALFDLLSIESGEAVMIDNTESDKNLSLIMSNPLMSYGSDSLYSSRLLHPRSVEGTKEYFKRFLSLKGKEKLSECVYRITGFNSEKLSLKNKGKIGLGMDADLAIISPEFFKTYKDPFIKAVLIKGEGVFYDGKVQKRMGEVI